MKQRYRQTDRRRVLVYCQKKQSLSCMAKIPVNRRIIIVKYCVKVKYVLHLVHHTIFCANLYFGVKMLTSGRTNGQTKWHIEEFTLAKQLLKLVDRKFEVKWFP